MKTETLYKKTKRKKAIPVLGNHLWHQEIGNINRKKKREEHAFFFL